MKRSIEDVVRAAAAIERRPVKSIMGRYRLPRLVIIREAIALVGRNRGWSYEKIGRGINRNHSTVIYLTRRQSTAARELAVEIEVKLTEPTTFERYMRGEYDRPQA